MLHINLDGTPAAGNPNGRPSTRWDIATRRTLRCGQRPAGVYVIEHGTDKDDELNLLRAGGNYGYSPNRAPLIYDESVPMTDPGPCAGRDLPGVADRQLDSRHRRPGVLCRVAVNGSVAD